MLKLISGVFFHTFFHCSLVEGTLVGQHLSLYAFATCFRLFNNAFFFNKKVDIAEKKEFNDGKIFKGLVNPISAGIAAEHRE